MSTMDFIRSATSAFIMSLFLFTVIDGFGGMDAKIGFAVSLVWLLVEVWALIFTAGTVEDRP